MRRILLRGRCKLSGYVASCSPRYEAVAIALKRLPRSTPLLLLGAVLFAQVTLAGAQGNLEKIKFGFAQNTVSPIVIHFVLPRYLGYYREEGLEVELVTLGTNAAVMANLGQKRIEFGVGVPSFQLPLVAKGEKLQAINFYEHTYPFKWSLAVKPDSPIKTLEELKGKIVGVSGFGVTDYPVAKAIFRLIKMDPEKDLQWLAVGEGVTAGQALTRGHVAGLFYFDTGFGQIEAAGMKMRYLPLPNKVPKIGGLYISASRETLDTRRKAAIGLARAVAKASLFTLVNAEAAAYIFLQVYPEAAPRAVSVQDQVKAVALPITKRAPLFNHYDKSITDFGRILPSEWKEEIEFMALQGQIKDASIFFTNELVAEINKFDRQKIISEARNFKFPK